MRRKAKRGIGRRNRRSPRQAGSLLSVRERFQKPGVFRHDGFPVGPGVGLHKVQRGLESPPELVLGDPFAQLAAAPQWTATVREIRGNDDPSLFREDAGSRAVPDPSGRLVEVEENQLTRIIRPQARHVAVVVHRKAQEFLEEIDRPPARAAGVRIQVGFLFRHPDTNGQLERLVTGRPTFPIEKEPPVGQQCSQRDQAQDSRSEKETSTLHAGPGIGTSRRNRGLRRAWVACSKAWPKPSNGPSVQRAPKKDRPTGSPPT